MNDGEVSRELQDALDALVRSGDIVRSNDGRYWPVPADMHKAPIRVRPLTVELPVECTIEDSIAEAAVAEL